MAGIEKVRIAYSDPELIQSLARFNNHRGGSIRKENLSKYRLNDITPENLKRSNMVFSFNKSAIPTYQPINSNNAETDQMLFSSRNEDVSTNASACYSYILFCENTKIVAAVHVGSKHTKDTFHKEMLLFAYANLLKMAPEDPISAYISGRYFFPGLKFKRAGEEMMRRTRTNLISVVEELMGSGIKIKEINIA